MAYAEKFTQSIAKQELKNIFGEQIKILSKVRHRGDIYKFRCKDHGVFGDNYQLLIHRNPKVVELGLCKLGCKQCHRVAANEYRISTRADANNIKKGIELNSLKELVILKFNGSVLYKSGFKKEALKCKFYCTEHSKYFYTSFKTLLNRTRSRCCVSGVSISEKTFKKRLRKLSSGIIYISGFTTLYQNTKAKFLCRIHGEFLAVPSTLLKSGSKCCRSTYDMRGQDAEACSVAFKRIFEEKYAERYELLSEYVSNRELVTVRCIKHDYIYTVIPEVVKKGTVYCSCPKCALSAKMNFKEVIVDGKMFTVQGYEGLALQYLVDKQNFDVDDIVRDVKDIPVIDYNYKGKRKHYPDLYIPHKNLLIEVKSWYTLLSIKANFY